MRVLPRARLAARAARADGDGPAAGASAVRTAMAFAVAVGVVVLALTHRDVLAEGISSLATADAQWLALATLAAAGIWVGGTVTQLGAVPMHPPLGRLFFVQVAGSFVNHLVPAGLGGMAVNVRFLRRLGMSRAAAVSAVALNSFATVVTHVLLLCGAGLLAPYVFATLRPWQRLALLRDQLVGVVTGPPGGWLVVGTVAVVGAGAVAAVRVGPRSVGRRILRVSAAGRRQAHQGLAQLSGVVREPARAAKLWLGSASVPVLHAVIVIAVYRSIGGVAPMMAIAVTYLAASALAGIIPSPGGLGTLDVTLVAGLVALGTPAATALAVTLGYRLITVWLPMLPGAVVFAVLVRRGVI